LYGPPISVGCDNYTGVVEPILLEGEVLGIIIGARLSEEPPFSQDDWHFLAAIASLAALYLGQERSAQKEKKLREQAAKLHEVANVLNSSLELQTVLELILDQLDRVIGYDSASIALITDHHLQIVAHRKLRSPEQLKIQGEIESFPHIQEVIEKRATVTIKDTAQDSRWRDLPKTGYIRCWLGVPLISQDQVIGLVNLDKEEANYYAEDSANIAMIFANQAAVAIENARYFTFAKNQVRQLDMLRATIADISTELELPKLLEAILGRAVDLLDAAGGDLAKYDETEKEIEIVASTLLGKDFRGTRMSLGEGAMGISLVTHQPVIVDDYLHWEKASPQFLDGGWHAVIAVPLIIGSRLMGAIAIMDNDPVRIFTKEDGYLLSLFAQQAAIAIENVRLYQEAREAAERRAILHQVSQQIVSAGLNLEGIYVAIHNAAAQLMPAEAFVITIHDESEHSIHDSYLVDRLGRAGSESFPEDQGLSGKVMRSGTTILIRDLIADPNRDDYLHFGDPDPVRSILAVPMRYRGKVIGMISAQSYIPDVYSPEDITLLEMLASYAAIALENANLFNHIQQLATIDPVSGIFNRRHLFDLGHLEFVRANRFSRTLSVIMMDIDHFKLINDRFGHAVGDYVLSKLAKILRGEVREVDVVGRYGGEEFTVILPETRLSTALDVAERLRRKINSTFQTGEPNSPQITVSIGVAEKSPDLENFSSLVELADRAMYAAKSAGRDRVEPYIPPDSTDSLSLKG
jgi:diguanylate cyclase (GGDEF)-like protein